jgi:hypothetical protein
MCSGIRDPVAVRELRQPQEIDVLKLHYKTGDLVSGFRCQRPESRESLSPVSSETIRQGEKWTNHSAYRGSFSDP